MPPYRRTGSPPGKWRLPLVIDRERNVQLTDLLWSLPVGLVSQEIISRLNESLKNNPNPIAALVPSAASTAQATRRAHMGGSQQRRRPTPPIEEIEAIGGEGGEKVENGSETQPTSAFTPENAVPTKPVPTDVNVEPGAGEQVEVDAETLAMLRAMDGGG